MISYIGIDIGITGAIAIITNKKIIDIIDYNLIAKPEELLKQYKKINNLSNKQKSLILIENYKYFSKQNQQNQMKYIETFFKHKFCLEYLNINYNIIDAKTWLKYYNINKNTNKKETWETALNIFDNTREWLQKKSKHHNRADALLIANYLKCISSN